MTNIDSSTSKNVDCLTIHICLLSFVPLIICSKQISPLIGVNLKANGGLHNLEHLHKEEHMSYITNSVQVVY